MNRNQGFDKSVVKNNSQSKTPADEEMGQVHAQKSLRCPDADAARLALAERLQAQLEAQACTIAGVCESFCEEARLKQAAFATASAEQQRQEQDLARLAQANEQKALSLEAEAEVQKTLTAKVEAARRNAQKLAARFELVATVTKDGACALQRAQALRVEKSLEVARLRACHQALNARDAVERDHLQALVRDERQQAMLEIRTCAERESQATSQHAQMDGRMSGERMRGLQLVDALAANKEALRKLRAQQDERLRAQREEAERLDKELKESRAVEQRLETQVAEFNAVAHAYQELLAQHDAAHAQLAQTSSALTAARGTADELRLELRDADELAGAAAQQAADVTQRAEMARRAAEVAAQLCAEEEEKLREADAQRVGVVERVEEVRVQSEAKERQLTDERAEEAELSARMLSLDAQRAELTAQTTHLLAVLAAARETTARVVAERDALNATLCDTKESLTSKQAEKAALSATLSETQTILATSRAARYAQFTQLSNAQTQLRAQHKHQADLLARIEAAESNTCAVRTDTAAISAQLCVKRAAIEDAERSADDLELGITGADAQLAAHEAEKAAVTARLREAEAQAQQVEAAQLRMAGQLDAAQLTVAKMAADTTDEEQLRAARETWAVGRELLFRRRAELLAVRAVAATRPATTAALAALRTKQAEQRAKDDREEAELDAHIASVGEKRRALALQLDTARAAAQSRSQERVDAESKAAAQRGRVATLQATLEAANAKNRADAMQRAEELASAEQAARPTVDAGNVVKGKKVELEAALECQQVDSIRLKRQIKATEGRVRKVEKEIERVDAKDRASSKLAEENAVLERKNKELREVLAQHAVAKRKEEKFLEKLTATRSAQLHALKQEVHKADATHASLQWEASQAPRSCLKSPSENVSPGLGKSPAKRVVFNSQSEVKSSDTEPAQKVPTKRTSDPSGSTKRRLKRGRSLSSDPVEKKSPKSSDGKSSPGSGRLSPKANPFYVPVSFEPQKDHGEE